MKDDEAVEVADVLDIEVDTENGTAIDNNDEETKE